MVWQAVVDGQALMFRLAGINNQNFLMQDARTGSWWQQVSGEAVQGPLRGRRLEPQDWDEITFGEFVERHPLGLVLLPDPRATEADAYAAADWEEGMDDVPVVTPVDPADALPPRALVIGLEIDGASRAYPRDGVGRERVVLDELGGVPIALLADADGLAVRAFRRRLDGVELELFAVPGASPARFVDAQTGSTWDAAGIAVEGPLAGRRLERVQALPDYWFDWKLYHPRTDVFATWTVVASADTSSSR